MLFFSLLVWSTLCVATRPYLIPSSLNIVFLSSSPCHSAIPSPSLGRMCLALTHVALRFQSRLLAAIMSVLVGRALAFVPSAVSTLGNTVFIRCRVMEISLRVHTVSP